MAAVGGVGSTTTSTDAAKDVFSGMGPDAFLKLLVAQMRYQNPMSPSDPSAMMGQIAQYAQVEALTKMQQGQATDQSLSEARLATDMVGKTISASDGTTTETGKVMSARFTATGPVLVLDTGAEVTLSAVVTVTESAASSTSTGTSTGTSAGTSTGTTGTTGSTGSTSDTSGTAGAGSGSGTTTNTIWAGRPVTSPSVPPAAAPPLVDPAAAVTQTAAAIPTVDPAAGVTSDPALADPLAAALVTAQPSPAVAVMTPASIAAAFDVAPPAPVGD